MNETQIALIQAWVQKKKKEVQSVQGRGRRFSLWLEGSGKLSQKRWGFEVDSDRLVKVYNAGKSISERGNSLGKNRRLEHRVPEGAWWETKLGAKLCWGLNSKPKHLALILNGIERGGRLHRYWALIGRWQSWSTPLNVSIVKGLGWMVSFA